MKQINYNIGLDIGTNSVGWAVTDMDNNLLKHKKQNMWGARLFNTAETAVERRVYRSTRRRMNRRKQRLALLRELMEPIITPIDPSFYARIAATQLHREDNQYKHGDNFNLFIDKNFNDKHYFAQYPTMYHLRNELINGKGKTEKIDPRLIYLALSHLLKYRGNFLYEDQDLSNITNAFDSEFFELSGLLNESEWILTEVTQEISKQIMCVFQDVTLYRSEQVKKAIDCLGKLGTTEKKKWQEIFKAITGMKMNAKTAFNDSFVNEAGKPISFSLNDTSFEETKDVLTTLLQDDIEIIDRLERMYSWYVLQNVLKGEESLTQAMIKKYEKHASDLKLLKSVVREHCTQEMYVRFFRSDDDKLINYVNYTKKTFVKNKKQKAKKTCTQIDLYTEIKKLLKNYEADQRVQQIFVDIDQEIFLPKQNSTDNGAIPYQLQLEELKQILTNQSQFYPELAAVQDKIQQILTFRIPYYVGPLTETEKSIFSWAEFKQTGRIYPWNFEELVDRDQSAEKFIRKMTSTCTYIIGEPVFPRYSLLYNEFTVLNELNKVRINGKLLEPNQKKEIFQHCFQQSFKKTVTKKDIITFCQQNWQPYNGSYEITGTQDEKGFAANLNSYIDFVKIFGNEFVHENNGMIEQLIEWLTVFEDKKIIERKISQNYPELSDDIIKKITRLRYSGWSKLSKKLLIGLTTFIDEKSYTIMDILWNKNLNFMQIINSERYEFKAYLDDQLNKGENKKVTYEEIKQLAGSPALKRGIWQTIQIVDEIEKVVGCPATNIFIEFAREDQASKRTNSRLHQLEKLYENIDSDSELQDLRKELKHMDNKDINEKLFLYFIQNGRSAYSGTALNLENLNEYQVDHIIPRSLVKNDSIDNKVLVLATENQQKSDDKTAFSIATSQAKKLWEALKKTGLMTQRKYNYLMMPIFKEEYVKGFINRQLVETRQISKHVAQLLQRSNKANVYSLKSSIASDFRSKNKLFKTRTVNDYHHAHDAYLTTLVGNFIQKCYSGMNEEFLYESYLVYQSKKMKEIRKSRYNFLSSNMGEKQFDKETGLLIWDGEAEVAKVRKYLSYRDCFITKKLEENTGELWNLNPVKKKEGIHSRKSGMDSAKYGGYEGVNSAYSVIFTCEVITGAKAKRTLKKELLGIPVEYAKIAQTKPEVLSAYIQRKIIEKYEQKGGKVENIQIVRNKVLKNQLFELDGGLYTLASPTEWNNAKQLVLPKKYGDIISMFEKKGKLDEEINWIELYDYLVDKLDVYPVYKKQQQDLKNKRELFMQKSCNDKKTAILEILKITTARAENANLTVLSLSSRVGRLGGKTVDVTGRTFIDQSVTGMYSKKWQV